MMGGVKNGPAMLAGVAMGSNLGDRLGFLQRARAVVAELEGWVGALRWASVWETQPVDCPEGSGAFLNTVLVGEWALGAEALLKSLQGVERALGRPEVYGRNDPRVIDLDLLFLGEVVMKTPWLELPHPRWSERAFVVFPLAEVAGSRHLPGQRQTPVELREQFEKDDVEELPQLWCQDW